MTAPEVCDRDSDRCAGELAVIAGSCPLGHESALTVCAEHRGETSCLACWEDGRVWVAVALVELDPIGQR